MTYEQAIQLRELASVRSRLNGDYGRVAEVEGTRVRVRWKDGSNDWFFHNEAAELLDLGSKE